MVGSAWTADDEDVDYKEDFPEEEPPVQSGSGKAASGGAAAAETATEQPDFAVFLGSDPAVLGRLLQGFQNQRQQTEARPSKTPKKHGGGGISD
jgi:hypothetical protein